MMTNLPLSRPTPQTRILAIGWEWSTLRSMGSTRFNILFSSSRYMSFPWTNTHTHKFFRSHYRNMQSWFPEAQDAAKKSSHLKGQVLSFFLFANKVYFPACTHKCVCVSVCLSWINYQTLKRGGGRWKVIEKGMKLSLSLCSVASH